MEPQEFLTTNNNYEKRFYIDSGASVVHSWFLFPFYTRLFPTCLVYGGDVCCIRPLPFHFPLGIIQHCHLVHVGVLSQLFYSPCRDNFQQAAILFSIFHFVQAFSANHKIRHPCGEYAERKQCTANLVWKITTKLRDPSFAWLKNILKL